ncbi:hypothetical protein ID741_001305 [Enterococcus sp. AZ103]
MSNKKRNSESVKLAESSLNTYQPEFVKDTQDVLKGVFGSLLEKMLQGELNNHLGINSILKSLRNMKIVGMVMGIKHSKQVLMK